MPIYEYACPKCGDFEERQSLNDPVLKRCPICKSKVTKLISSSAFALKGGGWYSDAYQKKATPSASPSATPSATPSESSGSSSSTTPSSSPSGGSSSGSSD